MIICLLLCCLSLKKVASTKYFWKPNRWVYTHQLHFVPFLLIILFYFGLFFEKFSSFNSSYINWYHIWINLTILDQNRRQNVLKSDNFNLWFFSCNSTAKKNFSFKNTKPNFKNFHGEPIFIFSKKKIQKIIIKRGITFLSFVQFKIMKTYLFLNTFFFQNRIKND